MSNLADTVRAIADGKLAGYGKPSRIIDAAISTVFIFEPQATVLKLYKEDRPYFTIGTGLTRRDFITKDFTFNKLVNPGLYLDVLEVARSAEGEFELLSPSAEGDNLVILMKAFDTRNVFTDFLYEGRLTPEHAYALGSQVATERLTYRNFSLEHTDKNWSELFMSRIENIETWPEHIPTLDQEIVGEGFRRLHGMLEGLKDDMAACSGDRLWVSTDCTSENSYIEDGKLRFFDAFHPQPDWRHADFDFDLVRVASDIRALAGKEHYVSFLEGVQAATGTLFNPKTLPLYMLFSSLVMAMYLTFRAANEKRYDPIAAKYLEAVRQ